MSQTCINFEATIDCSNRVNIRSSDQAVSSINNDLLLLVNVCAASSRAYYTIQSISCDVNCI